MADLAVGDAVVVYTSESGIREGILIALAKEESNIPLYTVRLGESFWAGPELHVFPAGTDEEDVRTEVEYRLATYGQELATRRAERDAQYEAAMATEEGEEAEEGEEGETAGSE